MTDRRRRPAAAKPNISRVLKMLFRFYPKLVPVSMACTVFSAIVATVPAVLQQKILASIEQIPCTSCHYCTGGCPMNIKIPDIFGAMNRLLIYNNEADARRRYGNATADAGKASDCIHCLQCEDACPQHIQITQWLEKAAAKLEA